MCINVQWRLNLENAKYITKVNVVARLSLEGIRHLRRSKFRPWINMVSKMETDHTGNWQRPKERCFLCVHFNGCNISWKISAEKKHQKSCLLPSKSVLMLEIVRACRVSAVRWGGRWGSRRADWLDWDWRHGAATSHSSDCGRGKLRNE